MKTILFIMKWSSLIAKNEKTKEKKFGKIDTWTYKFNEIDFFSFNSWTEIIVLFHLSFYLTWLFFAVIYYAICYYHGDLDPENLPPLQVCFSSLLHKFCATKYQSIKPFYNSFKISQNLGPLSN